MLGVLILSFVTRSLRIAVATSPQSWSLWWLPSSVTMTAVRRRITRNPPSNNHRGLHLTVLYTATSMRGGLSTRKCSCPSVLIVSTRSLRAISLRGVCGVGVSVLCVRWDCVCVCVCGAGVWSVRVFTVWELHVQVFFQQVLVIIIKFCFIWSSSSYYGGLSSSQSIDLTFHSFQTAPSHNRWAVCGVCGWVVCVGEVSIIAVLFAVATCTM